MLKKSVLFFFLCMLLSGCSERSLQVLTVEFNSGAVVPNVTVALIDAKTEETITTKQSNEEGEVTFTDLKHNHEYILSNVSLNESVIIDSSIFTYEKDMAYYLFETHFPNNRQGLALPIIEQPEGMKSGAALVALTSVLHYYGLHVTVDDVYAAFSQQPFTIENGHRLGAHPNEVFVGDAYGEESYVLAKPVAEAAVSLLETQQKNLSVFNASGSTQAQLMQIVKSGVPIIAWITKDLAEPKRVSWQLHGATEQFSIPRNIEPVVIIGMNANKYHVISQFEHKQYDSEAFYNNFAQVGSQAVVIRK